MKSAFNKIVQTILEANEKSDESMVLRITLSDSSGKEVDSHECKGSKELFKKACSVGKDDSKDEENEKSETSRKLKIIAHRAVSNKISPEQAGKQVKDVSSKKESGEKSGFTYF